MSLSLPPSAAASAVLGLPDLIGEILLRVDDSANLVPASAVCRAWYARRLPSWVPPGIHEARAQPLASVLLRVHAGPGFVPAAQPPELAGVYRQISRAIPEWLDGADDCHHGRVLRRLGEALAIYVLFRPESSVFLPLPPLHKFVGHVYSLLRDDDDGSNWPSCVLVTADPRRDAIVVQVSIFQVFVAGLPMGFNKYDWGRHQLSKGEEGSLLYVHVDGFRLNVCKYMKPDWYQVELWY
ncbi:hypothetical protein E2562_015878 [Oryza meyeriana var. granulata]|uniref:F-box domain-containing protein n=1 Tax=Oryza meyeriana var. granulata TaxID=110450 RepID=A0A6G1D4P3_9ORYZ|nr:hypothetical protein E2562_015878 [Oryza meyeriana var. granulata]